MKIQYASDLHLEFGMNTAFLNAHPIIPSGDVLILAGDIGYLGDDAMTRHPFWDWVSENFKEVVAIPGNHELYGHFDINELYEGWELYLRHNVRYVYNKSIHLDDDIDLIATTLWSEILPDAGYIIQRKVNDFHLIKDGDKELTWRRFNEEHRKCVSFIDNALRESKADKLIVATHHVPSFALMDKDFIGSPINGAFVSELGNFIADSRVNYWIYGHSHRNIKKRIGDAECVSNQLGYVKGMEHLHFKRDAVIEL